MNSIVVSDTNIFIDLLSINLLSDFFNLPIHVHTLDYVLNELEVRQQEEICKYNIVIKNHTSKEFDSVSVFMQSNSNISFIDCAVWLYAKNNNYRLLTGDKVLRKYAEVDGVLVSGILFVFDMLVEFNIIDKQTAVHKLSELSGINSRLPKREIEERIFKWSN
jgi:predicted nucleic acid-binding protein